MHKPLKPTRLVTSLYMSLRHSPIIPFVFLLTSCGETSNMPPYPTDILPQLLWSIAEPIPADVADFREALARYGDDIEAGQDLSDFDTTFPSDALDIRYSYAIQKPSGSWEEKYEVVQIRADSPLTYGEIVLRLHRAAHHHLVEQDHHYYEGLELITREYESGVPVYELITGS